MSRISVTAESWAGSPGSIKNIWTYMCMYLFEQINPFLLLKYSEIKRLYSMLSKKDTIFFMLKCSY
jgi:hypothetical protein